MSAAKVLPTEQGSVIGWVFYHDTNYYGCAMLDYAADDDSDEMVWYLAGIAKTMTPEEVDKIGWEYIGKMTPFR